MKDPFTQEGNYLVSNCNMCTLDYPCNNCNIYPNLRSEKEVIKPLHIPLQSQILTESKSQTYVKSRIGEGRAGLKEKNTPNIPYASSTTKTR